MNLNEHKIIGRVTRDPEMRTTQTGQVVATFSVATNNSWKDKQGAKQEQVTFHNVVAWGKLAEICGQYVKKGQLIYCAGRVDNRSWDKPDGTKGYRTEIVLENMQMGPKSSGSSEYSGQAEHAVKEGMKSVASESGDIQIEDIPF